MTAENISAESPLKKIKVSYISEIPTPYRRPFLKRLSEHPELDLKVLYLSATQQDREWNAEHELYPFEKVLPGYHWCSNKDKGYYNRFNPAIFSELSVGRCDVAVFGAYYVMSMLLGLHWSRLRKIPYVIQCESHKRRKRNGFKVFLKDAMITTLIKNASAWLPLGTLAREYLVSYGADLEGCYFCPNSPDVESLKETCKNLGAEASIKEKFGINPSHKVILYVGRFIDIKRVDLLIKAFSILKREKKDISMVLAGSGKLEDELRLLVDGLKVEDVHFTGFIQPVQLPELYKMADVMVLPSDDEPWAVVVNESLACGTPVIASDRVGAAIDMVKDNETGFVFKAGDVTSLHKALADFFSFDNFKNKNSSKCVMMAENWGYDLCIESFVKAVRRAAPTA